MKSFKKFIKGNLFESIILAAIGFVCGYFVDSVLFHINPLFCGKPVFLRNALRAEKTQVFFGGNGHLEKSAGGDNSVRAVDVRGGAVAGKVRRYRNNRGGAFGRRRGVYLRDYELFGVERRKQHPDERAVFVGA